MSFVLDIAGVVIKCCRVTTIRTYPANWGWVGYLLPDFPDNGGLPSFLVSGLSFFGSSGYIPAIERQNIYQILDNATKIFGNHSLKLGLGLQVVRTAFGEPQAPRGQYTYNGLYTSNLGASFTGFGTADFLANQMYTTQISPDITQDNYRWYRSVYAEDDWRFNSKLTLNLGLRYDYFQPYTNSAGALTNLVVTPPFGGIGTGTGILEVPARIQSKSVFPPAFLSLLAASNVSLQYVNSLSVAVAQKTNFAPRLGFAYQIDPRTVIRGG